MTLMPLSAYAILAVAALVGAVAFDFWWRFGMRFDSAASVETLRGKIFLTFDDGPASAHAGWSTRAEDANAISEVVRTIDPDWNFDVSPTQNLQRVLAQFETKAVFFVRGDILEADADARRTVGALHDAGHVIGNHSFSHARLREISPAASVDQLERTDRLIGAITRVPVELFRPPYGRWHIGLTWRVWRRPALRHYALPLGWSHATSDWDMTASDMDPLKLRRTVETLLDSFRSSPTAIILLQHDIWIYTALLTRVLLGRLAGDTTLQTGDPRELVRHARDTTRHAGPAAIGFYIRARARQMKRRLSKSPS